MVLDDNLFFALNFLAGIDLISWFWALVVNEYFVPVLLALVLFYLWITPFKRNKEGVLLAAASVGMVNLIIKLINLVYFRYRPFEVLEVNLLYYRPTDSSFPANSAAVAFAIAAAIYYVDRRIGVGVLISAGIFSLSRVVVGVHYPSDVFIGVLLGAGATYLLSRLKKPLELATSLLIKVLKLVGLEPLY
jgi:undecaprenyl-diphosphatase